MHYHFKIREEKPGFWAECVELSGCVTQGDTREELFKNMEEALNLYLDEPESSRYVFPLPKKEVKGNDTIAVPVRPSIAFALLLKKERLEHDWTQKEVAEKLGMKNLYSYQRLEDPQKANPALRTIQKIKVVFPGLNIDDVVQ